jgi:hypothetical protein
LVLARPLSRRLVAAMAYKIVLTDSWQIAHLRRCSMTDLRGWKPVSLADDDDEEKGDDEEEDEDE